MFVKKKKEGNVLFSDALNTFCVLLYCDGHMVNNHSNSERGNLLPPLHGLLFSISSKGSLYALSHRHDSTYLCYISRGALAVIRNTTMVPLPWSYTSTLWLQVKAKYHTIGNQSKTDPTSDERPQNKHTHTHTNTHTHTHTHTHKKINANMQWRNNKKERNFPVYQPLSPLSQIKLFLFV